MRGMSSYVVNDKLRAYAGHDYEKVMLLTYMALNHVAHGRLRQRPRGDQAGARARGADRRAARAAVRRGGGVGAPARRAHQLQGAERLSGRDPRQPGGERAQERLPERAVALSRRLHLRGARRAEPGGAGLPPRERAAARPAAAGRGAARARRARRRARRWHDRRAGDHRHRHRAGAAVAPVRCCRWWSTTGCSCCRTRSRS